MPETLDLNVLADQLAAMQGKLAQAGVVIQPTQPGGFVTLRERLDALGQRPVVDRESVDAVRAEAAATIVGLKNARESGRVEAQKVGLVMEALEIGVGLISLLAQAAK